MKEGKIKGQRGIREREKEWRSEGRKKETCSSISLSLQRLLVQIKVLLFYGSYPFPFRSWGLLFLQTSLHRAAVISQNTVCLITFKWWATLFEKNLKSSVWPSRSCTICSCLHFSPLFLAPCSPVTLAMLPPVSESLQRLIPLFSTVFFQNFISLLISSH